MIKFSAISEEKGWRRWTRRIYVRPSSSSFTRTPIRFDSSKASASTLIYRIAHNTLIDFYRTKKQHSEIDEEIAYTNETLAELKDFLE